MSSVLSAITLFNGNEICLGNSEYVDLFYVVFGIRFACLYDCTNRSDVLFFMFVVCQTEWFSCCLSVVNGSHVLYSVFCCIIVRNTAGNMSVFEWWLSGERSQEPIMTFAAVTMCGCLNGGCRGTDRESLS